MTIVNRRNFLKTGALAAAGSLALPYILPTGRLFAQSGSQLAPHVVLVMFAGGVRHQESIGQYYIKQAQYAYNPVEENTAEGNIMPNMLVGAPPDRKVVYGKNPPGVVTEGGLSGSIVDPPILQSPLQTSGTLFREMSSGTAGHYSGLNALVTGNYARSQGLRQKPILPTIFEYVRRHMGLAATKVWFVGNSIGSSTPLLNYSTHADYGSAYGANFFAPSTTFGGKGFEFFSEARNYHPEEELPYMQEMTNFLNNSFLTTGKPLPDLKNTEAEKYDIKQFMKYMYETGNDIVNSSVDGQMMNGDVQNMLYTCQIMKWFKPNLTVLNMGGVDGCHGNFTNYLRSLYRADYAVGYLWKYINQQIPEMAANTIMLVAPECGRNAEPNPIRDFNEWRAYDHSDANAMRVFGMMNGPNVPQNMVLGNDANLIGNIAQVPLTIAEILGCKTDVMNAGHVYNSQSWFDLI